MKIYGITEKKKSELDALTAEVLDAQYEVQQYDAIVTSLQDKLQKFQGFLDEATSNTDSTLVNKNLVEQLVQDVIDLRKNSNITFTEMGLEWQLIGIMAVFAIPGFTLLLINYKKIKG